MHRPVFDSDDSDNEDKVWSQSEPPKGLRHRGQKHTRCENCGQIVDSTVKLPRCQGCVEAGPQSQEVTILSPNQTPPPEESVHKPTSFVVPIWKAARSFQNGILFLLTLLGYTLGRILEVVCLSFFLFVPVYYSANASSVLELANVCERGGPVSPPDTDISPDGGIQMTTMVNTVSAPPPRRLDTAASYTALSPSDTLNGSAFLPSPSPPIETRPSSQLQHAWVDYIETCVTEWKYSISLSSVMLALSGALTAFQISGTSTNLSIRIFVSLGLFRAFLGVIYGPILYRFFYNPKSHMQTEHFAMLWIQNPKRKNGRTNWKPWIILSLPAAATLWSLIFMIIALFASIWHTGVSALGSSPPPLLPIGQIGLLRFILVGWALLDIGLVGWTVWTIKWIGAAAKERATQSAANNIR